MKTSPVLSTALLAAVGHAATVPRSSQAGFKWLGVSESVAEFGNKNFPGIFGKDYSFPDPNAIDTLMSDGFNTFRIPFAMERMAPGTITATLDPAYLGNISQVASHITSKGGYAILDPHNFGRYNGQIITNTQGFQTFWQNVASNFKSDPNIIFDTNNEYHDMDASAVFNLNQAAINGVRAAGATTQTIFVEGNSYSSAQQWPTVSSNLANLKDPNNNIVYQMHLYLDSDSSGTHEACVSTSVGVDRATPSTNWLKQNGKKGIIGEFAGGANSNCMQAIKNLLSHLHTNSDVWEGALWWAAGPWWGNYMYDFEPPSGTAYTYYKSTLLQYGPGK